MRNVNERPVCHRAEDLVSYLYGEATPVEARDFAEHMEQCDACRAEFATFRQVHKSVMLWRNEALGAAVSQAPEIAAPLTTAIKPNQFVLHERKLSALPALREFFSVAPLWLRGAIAFAALLLCLLGALGISRLWRQPTQVVVNNAYQKVYTQADLENAVRTALENQSGLKNLPVQTRLSPTPANVSRPNSLRHQNLTRSQLARIPQTRLTRQEREQLAADLRLIPGKEDELPFVFPDEPNQ